MGIGICIRMGISSYGNSASVPSDIMFLGDSLAMGYNSTNTLGLRGDLSWYLSLLGANIEFVGPFSTGGAALPDPDHCAQSGASTSTILSNFITHFNSNTSWKPRIIICDGGINDVANNGVVAATAATSVDSMLRSILALARTRQPAAQIIYQNLFNLPPGDTYEAQVAPFNSAMVTKVSAINADYGANSVQIFDANTALGVWETSIMGGDRLHPAESGWAILRSEFLTQFRSQFRAIRNSINSLSITVTSPSEGAVLTVGVPASITGTVSRPKQDVVVTPIKGGSDLPIATVSQYAGTWSSNYTPVTGDIGALTIGARVNDIIDSSFALAGIVGVTVQAAPPSDPLAIITSVAHRFWMRADLGIVESGGAGTGVTQWTDQSGSGNHFVQAGASNLRPTITTSVAAFGNQPAIGFDGVDDYLNNPIDLPAPGTSSIFIWGVFRNRAWTSGRALLGNNSTNCYVRAIVATPQMYLNWGTLSGANSGATINSAARLALLLNNATSDYLRIGASGKTTGINLGNTNPGSGLGLGAYSNGTNPSNCEWAEIGATVGEPTSGELTNLDAYLVTRYGVGLLV